MWKALGWQLEQNALGGTLERNEVSSGMWSTREHMNTEAGAWLPLGEPWRHEAGWSSRQLQGEEGGRQEGSLDYQGLVWQRWTEYRVDTEEINSAQTLSTGPYLGEFQMLFLNDSNAEGFSSHRRTTDDTI